MDFTNLVKSLYFQQKNNIQEIFFMTSIKILKEKFNRLDINETNIELYEKLFSLNHIQYKLLITEILEGRLDIEHTRPLFSKNLSSKQGITGLPLLSELHDTIDIIKSNITNKLLKSNEIIFEGDVLTNDLDLKFKLGERYESETNTVLSDVQKEKIFTGNNGLRQNTTQIDRIELEVYADKKQTQLTNFSLLSPDDSEFI